MIKIIRSNKNDKNNNNNNIYNDGSNDENNNDNCNSENNSHDQQWHKDNDGKRMIMIMIIEWNYFSIFAH